MYYRTCIILLNKVFYRETLIFHVFQCEVNLTYFRVTHTHTHMTYIHIYLYILTFYIIHDIKLPCTHPQ